MNQIRKSNSISCLSSGPMPREMFRLQSGVLANELGVLCSELEFKRISTGRDLITEIN